MKLRFQYAFSTAVGRWDTGLVVPIGEPVHIAIQFDASSYLNDPVILIDGQAQTIGFGLTEDQAPVGTGLGDAGYALAIGSNHAGTRHMNGRLDELAFFDELLPSWWIQMNADRVFGILE